MAKNLPGFDEIIDHQLSEDGVTPITVGHVASYAFLRQAVELLKAGDPTAHEIYVSIKHPSSGATAETRREGYVFALESAAELAIRFYDRKLTKSPTSPQ